MYQALHYIPAEKEMEFVHASAEMVKTQENAHIKANEAQKHEINIPLHVLVTGRIKAGLLKLRTAVHNPDREDVSGGPRQSPNLVQNPI